MQIVSVFFIALVACKLYLSICFGFIFSVNTDQECHFVCVHVVARHSQARDLEAAALKAVERRGGRLASKSGVLKFDGYSEAWLQNSLKVTNIRELVDWVYEDESNTSE